MYTNLRLEVWWLSKSLSCLFGSHLMKRKFNDWYMSTVIISASEVAEELNMESLLFMLFIVYFSFIISSQRVMYITEKKFFARIANRSILLAAVF